jgi:activating signal cointegrator complex subunit 3
MRGKVLQVVRELDKIKLIRFDLINETVSSTELGRITSHFYIKCETMENFCNALHISISHDNPTGISKKYDYKSDLQLLNVLAQSKEFENIRVRIEEF